MALLAISIVISAVSAADLQKNDFGGDFAVDIPSESNFSENVTTKLNFCDIAMDLVVFENTGNNSEDINSIIYFKDSSDNKTMIEDFINDLEKDGKKVEETDKYIVLETNTSESEDFDIVEGFNEVWNFAESLFSSEGDINLSADGNKISLSDKGLEVSDANGQNVSITSEGVSISGNETLDNESFDVSGDVEVNSNINDCDYAVYLENADNDQVIVLSGNNLEVLKSMAETASFK